MSPWRPSVWIHRLLLIGLALLASCALPSQARREQSSAGLTGHGNVAVAAVRTTAVSALRQPFTTVKLGLAMAWHRPRAVILGNLPARPQPAQPAVPGSAEFEALLDSKRLPPAQLGTLDWLIDGRAFFPELDRQIAAARHSVDLQFFIFDNDDIAVRCADVLKKRADEVRVRVLFDDLGSSMAHTAAPETLGPRGFVPPPDMNQYLRANSQVQVRRIVTPWLAADHTKLAVFDGRSAILGGMNIGREYFSEWHDVMVRVEGPVVASLAGEFNRAWHKAGALGDLALLMRKSPNLQRPPPLGRDIPLRVLRSDPAEGRHDIRDAMLLAIRGARQRVWIESPYFASDEIAHAVEAAARRGVDVRVILPAAGDSPLMDAGNLATASGLIRAGAKVYHYPRMNHTKVMVCDGWATFGSANLDILSLRINRELNLAFSHPAALRELTDRVLLADLRVSKRLRLADTAGLLPGIAETIADQL